MVTFTVDFWVRLFYHCSELVTWTFSLTYCEMFYKLMCFISCVSKRVFRCYCFQIILGCFVLVALPSANWHNK